MIFYHIDPISYILFLRICWEVRVAKECTEILSRFILTIENIKEAFNKLTMLKRNASLKGKLRDIHRNGCEGDFDKAWSLRNKQKIT